MDKIKAETLHGKARLLMTIPGNGAIMVPLDRMTFRLLRPDQSPRFIRVEMQ